MHLRMDQVKSVEDSPSKILNTSYYFKSFEDCHSQILLGPWPTKYTVLHVTFWRSKLRGQFSENLELRIYGFLFTSGDRISKEKKLWKFCELKI